MSGVALPHGCRVTHGTGAAIKTPFSDMPLVMHEMSAGGIAFAGPYGFIPFTEQIRLPRHVHLSTPDEAGTRRLLAERILVLNGCGLVELAGALHVVAPGSLVDIGPGVPHSWTACPAGLRLPDGSTSDGSFLMVYQYEASTGFFPTAAIAPIAGVADYKPHDGDDASIRIPRFDAAAVRSFGMVWDDCVPRA